MDADPIIETEYHDISDDGLCAAINNDTLSWRTIAGNMLVPVNDVVNCLRLSRRHSDATASSSAID